jgi:prephenate dehydrogenase
MNETSTNIPMQKPLWQKVTIAGVGLLGGSLGLLLKKKKAAAQVCGLVRRHETIKEAIELDALDYGTTDLKEAVSDADLVILCTPVSRMPVLASAFKPFLKPDCTVTDVGSVKGNLVKEMEKIFNQSQAAFVGSHPMAGSEKTGVKYASANLFNGSVCIITPTVNTKASVIEKVETLWTLAGATILKTDPETHDKLVAYASHLPHVIAAALVNLVLKESHISAQKKVCANGFRDTTRVASGSPEMWLDIVMENKEQITGAIKQFELVLNQVREAISKNDQDAVLSFLTTAKQKRDSWLAERFPDHTTQATLE